MEGLQWILTYYLVGLSNWNWRYEYHYAPFLSDLCQHTNNFIFPRYGRTIPNHPFAQLISVLPSKSVHLIPKPLDTLLTSKKSPIID